MDHRLPGSSVHGILLARILEWVAVASSRGSSWLRDRNRVSSLFHWRAGSLPPALPGKLRPSSVQSSCSIMSNSLRPTGLQHARLPCPSPTSRSLLKLISIELVMLSNHLILCIPFSLLQSFPTSGSFQTSYFFASGGQSFGVSGSTSVLPMNTQDWSPLAWTGWISLVSKGLWRVFSNTTVQKHQFFSTQLSL